MPTSRPFISRVVVVALMGLALTSAAACSSSATAPSPTPTTDASLVTVFINGGVYSANPLTVTLGQSVNWKNNDNVTHTATSTSGPITFDNNNIAAMSAQGAPVVMTSRGTITYRCTIHGDTGVIIVQ